MRRQKPKERKLNILTNIGLIIVAIYLAYSVVTRAYTCSVAENDFLREAREVLEHPACNSQREIFELFGMDCEKTRKKLSPTETDLRWWSCLFSSVSILQTPTTWIALTACAYIATLWLKYINYAPNSHASTQPTPPPQHIIYLQPPSTASNFRSDSEEEDSFHSSEEERLEEGQVLLLPPGTRRRNKRRNS